MAIIYSYPKTAPLAADLLIVSRQPSDPDETANYSVSVSDIATLVTGLQQYTLKAGTKVGTSVPLTLDSDTGTDSTVNFTEGSNITLTQTSATEITIAASSGGISGSGSSGQVVFWDGTSSINGNNNLFWDNANNYLGIGTTSLSELFEIHGADPSMVIKNTTYGSGESTLVFQTAMGAKNYLACNSSNALNYKNTAGNTLFTIENSGDVGIGTTTPSRKLEVIGTDGAAKFYYNSSFTNAQYSVVDVGMMTSGTAANGFGPKITFRMGGNGYNGYAAGTIGTIRNGADNTHNLNFGTSNSGSMTTKMTITNAGNVGIGTTIPASKLEVDGGDIEIDDSASGLILRSPNATRYRVQVDNSGNLTTTAV